MRNRDIAWRGLSLSLSVLALLVVLDITLSDRFNINGAYPTAAVLAAAVTGVRTTAVVAALSVALSVASVTWQPMGPLEFAVRIGLAVVLGVLAVVVCRARVRTVERLTRMTVIADTAQRAVLGAVPSVAGGVGFASRYVAAADHALVGGDLYEVAATPYGVRLVVGDVRGKGLEAVALAAAVLAGFRRAAFVEPGLDEVARALDGVVGGVGGPEDFVTALLVEIDGDRVSVVNCGHHPPVLVPGRGGEPVRFLDIGEPLLPLGMGGLLAGPAAVERAAAEPAAVPPRTVPSQAGTPGRGVRPADAGPGCPLARVDRGWEPGDRLLFYTDALVEARDRRGRYFDLETAAPGLRPGPLDDVLDGLVGALARHAGHRLTDDLALLLAERRETPGDGLRTSV